MHNDESPEIALSQDAEEPNITPLRSNSARKEQNRLSDGDSKCNSDVAIGQLHTAFDTASTPPCEISADEDVAFGFRVPQNPPAESTIATAPLRQQKCDVCCGYSKPGNLVRAVEGDYQKYSEIRIDFGEDRDSCLPFCDAIRRAQQLFQDHRVFGCGACRREFRRLLNVPKSNLKATVVLRRSIGNRILRNLQSQSTETSEIAPNTVQSHTCFLYSVTRASPETHCSAPRSNLARPRRLYSSEEWKKEEWITEFAKKASVSTDIAQQICDQSFSKHVKLCSKHYSVMRHVLDDIEESQKACSVCGGCSLNRSVSKTTKFPYDSLRDNVDVMCIIEDALASYVGRSLRPKDIKYLCAPCKYIICHRISFSELAPRSEEKKKLRKGDFVYGPTLKAVLHCISFTDNELSNNKKLMIRLTEVQEEYLRFIQHGDDIVEKQLLLKDVRSLKKYLLPSLASRGIYLEIGARKSGYYFCTLQTIKNLVAESNATRAAEQSSSRNAELSLKEREECLRELGKFFESRKEEIESGEWDLIGYLKATPKKLWLQEVCLFINRSLKARCRANARLRKVSLYEEWPYNLDECPKDLSELPAHELSFIVSHFYSLERDVYMLTQGRAKGPLYTSMSVASFTDVTTSFMSILNRVSCLTSYQTVDAMRRKAVARREKDGPFGEAVRSAFHSLAFDNINVRTANALDVHGCDNSSGFDGCASQLVDANPGFDFEKFCEGRPPEDCKPRKVTNISREEFIDTAPPSEKDPDLQLYRWMTMGLAVTHKDAIATDDESKQRSLRNVLLNGVKGNSGSKAKVLYVTISRESAQDELSIIRELKKIKQKLVDETRKERDKNNDTVIVAVVGDQPVFKILFKLWYESYEKYLDGVDDSGDGLSLCEWMVPLPGGFHIDKQGMQPLVKAILSGSGLEELAKLAGLSEKHKKNIIKLMHYRKSRRFLMQAMAAMILRFRDVACGADDEISKKIASLVEADAKVRERIRKGLETNSERTARLRRVKELHPPECKLELSDDMTVECIELGKLLCEAIDEMSKHSANVKFLAKVGLLDLLIPWSGYNVLARRGQTEIMDKCRVGWFPPLFSEAKLSGEHAMVCPSEGSYAPGCLRRAVQRGSHRFDPNCSRCYMCSP